jgi:hypothetical protein
MQPKLNTTLTVSIADQNLIQILVRNHNLSRTLDVAIFIKSPAQIYSLVSVGLYAI